jgi:hypothetical protein
VKRLSKFAVSVLEHVTEGVDFDSSRKIDNASGTFMALHVEKVGEGLFSLAHYFEQNGDLMSDPEMVFLRQDDGSWVPVSITQHSLGVYREAIQFENGKVARVSVGQIRELSEFTELWMRNVKQQQRLEIGARGAARTPESSLGCEAPA